MSLYAWTLLPLAILHLWLYRRHRPQFRFQLLLDVILAVDGMASSCEELHTAALITLANGFATPALTEDIVEALPIQPLDRES